MISGTWQVLYSSSTDQNNAVLLKVMTFSWDVACYFDTIGKTYSGDLSKCRVRFLRGSSLNSGTNVAFFCKEL